MAGIKSTVSILFMNRLKQLGLLSVWLWVSDRNPSGEINYHNNYHIFYMAWLYDQIYLSLGWEEQLNCDHLSALVACMFHDYNHTGGREDDHANILRAIAGFEEAYKHFKELPAMQKINPEKVKALIAITEYPYTDQARTLEEQCIRDADLLYTTVMGDPNVVLVHLRNEMEVLHNRKYTAEEMVKGYATFILEATLHTDIAKILRDEESPRFLKLLGYDELA